MHRSRLSTLLVDARTQDAAASAAFWSGALGTGEVDSPPGEPQFLSLHGAVHGLVMAVQAVDDEPRYHVDLETDDVPAEVERLLALGAAEVGRWLGCVTLRAPGGHLLCVIPVHSDPEEFAARSRVWP
ncbi:VOC family protein [Cellulomonas marina]|uniref:Glyoxalase-like domain-containing protein n=1 Tax=Cellulomonas marina TaxID=988821 RepID=A0A1I0WMX4_9CELL|nr:VOC family protein [Cellulomonas marina]GIG27762.1 hypothetical protein Cma02nite_03620 [Cellulomonas marina]SFA90089.1 hypothetical protein SAMN05421867_103111 [Cellulomonas marina]